MIYIKDLVGIYINNRICLEYYVYYKKKDEIIKSVF